MTGYAPERGDFDPSIDTRVREIVEERIVVAAPTRVAFNNGNPTTAYATRHPLTAFSALSNIRFEYGALASADSFPDNECVLQSALEVGGVIYPMTYNGSSFGSIGRHGWLASDPVPVDIPAGTTYYARTRLLAPNNAYNFNPTNGYTTLAADVSAAATTATTDFLPPVITNPMRMRFTGTGAEVAEVIRWTGTSAPFTAVLKSALANAHTIVGSHMGQGTWSNSTSYSDRGSASTTTITFDIMTDTFSASSPSATATLTNNQSIGDQIIQLSGVPPVGTVYTLDTSTDAETITVRNVTSLASPYTVYLTTPLTKNHLSGVTIAATIAADATISPTFVTADYAAQAPLAVALLGDSILQGSGNFQRTYESWAIMALDGSRPVLNIAKNGESAQQFANNTNGTQRRKLLDACGWVIYAYGTNDIYAGRTLAQVQADTRTILGWCRSRNMKIAMATITPRSTSTDGFVSVANQTEVNAGTNGIVRKQFNAWIRSGADGYADAVIETADKVETSRDSGKWIADPNPGPYCVDGLHPSLTGHALLATAVNPRIFV